MYHRTVKLDEHSYQEITTEGEIVARTSLSNALLEVLKLPPGFVRQEARYLVGEDGCTIAFTVVNKEVFCQP